MTIHRGPVRTLAGDREAAWPEAITGARCPRCGQFVGSVTVLMRDDPLGIGGD